MLTSKQFVRLVKKQRSTIYHVILKPSRKEKCETGEDPEEKIHMMELNDIPEEYRDIFREDLPKGLPPKRSVEMSIDLEKDARPKMGPIYKHSRKELEEIENK